MRAVPGSSSLSFAGLMLLVIAICAHAQAEDQLIHVNYDVKLTVHEEYGEVQQRGIATLGKTIVIDFGKHQVDVAITMHSADSYTLDVDVYEIGSDPRTKLSDDTPPYRSSFGVPSQIEIKNEVLELDLSIAVGQPFEKSTD